MFDRSEVYDDEVSIWHLAEVASRKRKRKRKHARVASSGAKRAFDVFWALALLVFLSPMLLLIAILIKFDSAGSVFFVQRRGGIDGRIFGIYKFRSMKVLEDGANVAQAKHADERVTRFGKFLRKTSLDEAPQLINILKGDMSFVGPRPHALAHDKEFSHLIPDYTKRFKARPGVTGLAQMRGLRGQIHSAEDLEGRIAADVEYIENWSFAMDMMILLKTVPVLLGHEKAY